MKVKPSFRPERDTSKMIGSARDEYCNQARTVLSLEVLTNEINREINKAAENILRRTSCDSEVAFERGRINALENLEKRLKSLAAEKKIIK